MYLHLEENCSCRADGFGAQQELFVAQVNLVRSQRDEIVAAYQALSAVGRMTALQLSLPVETYDLTKHYNEGAIRGGD